MKVTCNEVVSNMLLSTLSLTQSLLFHFCNSMQMTVDKGALVEAIAISYITMTAV